jgi:phosphoglucosamine mutase
MKQAVIAGLLASGAKTFNAGVLPTPTLALATGEFDAGVMITASHNPPQYNGIKLINPDGSAFNNDQQQQIEVRILDDYLPAASWDAFGDVSPHRGAIRKHIKHILKNFRGEYKIKVALDCGGGAASVITPDLLKKMGAEVVALNCQPTGLFPRDSEPNKANLESLMKETAESGADLGIAHDLDGDRMMAVDELGRFISGDRLMVILARELSAQEVVTTIDASMVIDKMGFNVSRTGVGDNHVSWQLKKQGDFGGEPSGSWIFPASSLCPDGIYAAAEMIAIASRQKLSLLVDSIPIYPIVRGSVAGNAMVMSSLERQLMSMEPLLVSKGDGIKLDFKDGWLLIRASGTEPKVRVTAEAKTDKRAHQLYNSAIRQIEVSRGKQGELR